MPDGSVDDHHVRPSSAPQSRRHAISVRPPHDLHARDAPESGKHAARERIGAAYEDRSAARQPGRGPPASEGPSVAAVPASGRGRPGSRHARAAIHCCACLLNSARVAPPAGMLPVGVRPSVCNPQCEGHQQSPSRQPARHTGFPAVRVEVFDRPPPAIPPGSASAEGPARRPRGAHCPAGPWHPRASLACAQDRKEASGPRSMPPRGTSALVPAHAKPECRKQYPGSPTPGRQHTRHARTVSSQPGRPPASLLRPL